MSASAPWTAPVADTADCDAAAANGPENTGQFFKHRDLPEKKKKKMHTLQIFPPPVRIGMSLWRSSMQVQATICRIRHETPLVCMTCSSQAEEGGWRVYGVTGTTGPTRGRHKARISFFFSFQKTRCRSINDIEMSRPLSPRLAGLQRQYCP